MNKIKRRSTLAYEMFTTGLRYLVINLSLRGAVSQTIEIN